MALVYVDRPAVHSTPYPDRPIRAVVIHDTESHQTVTTQQSAGGWHWQIDRPGQLYRDCDEDQAAWHVAAFGDNPALNRIPRPAWLVACPDGAVSDVNYCTIGCELVSDAQYRAAGEPYTGAQYAMLRALLADLGARYGPLPVVGHGELQTDRSDPVAFDWTKIPRILPTPGVPITFPLTGGATMPPLTDYQKDMLALMEPPLSLNADSVRQLVSDKAALEQQHEQDRQYQQSLEAQVEKLRAQPPPAPAVTVTSAGLAVRVVLSDGRAVEVPIP